MTSELIVRNISRRATSFATLAAACAAAVLITMPAHAAAPSTATDVLTRYERGEYDKALKTLEDTDYGEGFLLDLYKNAQKWIAQEGPGHADRRQRVVEVVALEAAGLQRSVRRQLIEWVCDAMRQSGAPPDTFEHQWFEASTALFEDLRDWVFLNGAPVGPNGSFVGTWLPLSTGTIQLGHLMHFEERFPHDPRAALARGVGIEFDARTVLDARRQTITAADLLAAEMIDVTDKRTAPRAAAVRRAIAVFLPLVPNDEVGAEAQLRLGYCQLRLGEHAEAIVNFERAEARAKGTWVSHNAALLRAWTLDRDGRHGEAEAAYRAALTAMPLARTAVTLFTASLEMNGRGAEAETLSEEFLTAKEAATALDPWQGYLTGDARRYDRLVAQLREALK